MTATSAVTPAAPNTSSTAVELQEVTPEGAQLRIQLYRLIDQMSDEKVSTLYDFLTVDEYDGVDPRDVDFKPISFDHGIAEDEWMDCEEEGFYDDYDESEVDPRDMAFKPIVGTVDPAVGYANVAADEEDRKEAEEWISGTVQIFED